MDTGFVDRTGADASLRFPGPRDAAAPADATLSSDVDANVDRWERYCNVPNPGPCCCEAFELELLPPAEAGASCDFPVTPPGRYRFRPELVNLDAELPDGGREGVVEEQTCAGHEQGWTLVSKDPPLVRLCPGTCSRLGAGEYRAIIVMQGCYTIACP